MTNYCLYILWLLGVDMPKSILLWYFYFNTKFWYSILPYSLDLFLPKSVSQCNHLSHLNLYCMCIQCYCFVLNHCVSITEYNNNDIFSCAIDIYLLLNFTFDIVYCLNIHYNIFIRFVLNLFNSDIIL